MDQNFHMQNEVTKICNETGRSQNNNNAELSNSPVKTWNLHQKEKLSGKALVIDLNFKGQIASKTQCRPA